MNDIYQTLLAQEISLGSSQWITWLAENSTWLAQSSVNFFLQSTVLILVGLIAARLLKKQGSAIQSAVYRATLVAVIACPLGAIGLGYCGFSGWTLELPKATDRVSVAVAPEDATNEALAHRGDEDSLAFREYQPSKQVPVQESGPPSSTDMDLLGAEIVLSQFPMETQRSLPSSVSVTANAQAAAAPIFIEKESTNALLVICYAVVGIVWLIGSLVLLSKLLLAFMALKRLRDQSPLAASDDVELCHQIADRIKVTAPGVRRNSLLSSPCLTGIAAPTILLPIQIESRVPLEKAFAHELAHLRRRDTLWNLVQRTALAIFFFQPLLWRLVYRLETSAEEVCDDFVVRHCPDRTGYAQQLVELAESNLLAPEMAQLEVASLRMFSRKKMLGNRVGRILDTTRKLTTSVSAPVVATIATLTLSAAMFSGLIGNGTQNDAKFDSVTADETKAEVDGNAVKVSGRVVGADGKPVAGVKLSAMPDSNLNFANLDRSDPYTSTVSNSDGTYEISFGDAALQKSASFVVVASKNGHGLGWADGKKLKAADLSGGQAKYRNADIELVASGTPMRLKIVDTEGNPVSGATVKINQIFTYKDNDFSPILENAKKKLHFREAVVGHMDDMLLFPGLPDYETDNQGNVTITGLGDQRTIAIEVIGDSICSTISQHMTMDHSVITFDYGGMGSHQIKFHGPNATLTCEPTQPIIGKVVDRKTQQPLAGVDIFSELFAGEKMSGIHRVKTKSKADGTFRLVGMPKGPGNEIVIIPHDDQPYFMTTQTVPAGPGLTPVEMKIELDKGIWIRGKAIDKNTKEPIVGARLCFLPFLSNKIAAALPSAADGTNFGTFSIQDRYTTAADGSFQLVGLPGKSVVGLVEASGLYPSGAGFETIDAEEIDQKRGHAKTFHNPITPFKKWPTAMQQVDVADDAKELNLHFELDSGLSFPLKIMDDAGNPLTGVTISRLRSNTDYLYESTDSNVVAGGFQPDEQRALRFVHKDKRLALIIQMDAAKEDSRQPRTIQLEPYATIKGRLVNEDGDPVAGGKVRLDVGGSQDFGMSLSERTTNENGEFVHEEICVGSSYSIGVGLPNDFRLVAKKLEISKSEEIDLGTVNIYDLESSPKPQRNPKPTGAIMD